MIKLRGTDIETTSLGYGCAGLMRLTSRRQRQAILAEVFDAGVRHFDVARMYGLGQVESEVGRFLKGRRDQAVVATKFGIEVKAATGVAAAVQVVGRYVLNRIPALRNLARRRAGNFYAPKNFSVDAARASLMQSLKALGTDYVDLFLLHEPTVGEVRDEGIVDFLENAKAKGMIRAWGVAGYPEQIGPMCERFPELARVIQIPNDVVQRQLEQFAGYRESAFITFSPYSESYARIKGHLINDAANRVRWSGRVGADLADVANLSAFALGYCLQSNPDGVVLFSSLRKQGVRSGVNTWRNGLSREQVQSFARLVSDEIGSAPEHPHE